MRVMMLLFVIALLIVPNCSEADEMYLGLKTYHFQRGGRDCLQETHDLIAYKSDEYGIHVGTYENSQCRRSHLVGTSFELVNGFGVDTSLVTGYPKAMHIVKHLTMIPMLTYINYYESVGYKLIYIPSEKTFKMEKIGLLIGVGLAIKF